MLCGFTENKSQKREKDGEKKSLRYIDFQSHAQLDEMDTQKFPQYLIHFESIVWYSLKQVMPKRKSTFFLNL